MTIFAGPGSSPTSVQPSKAFFYAPVVYVNLKPDGVTQIYETKSTTFISVDLPEDGKAPIARRRNNIDLSDDGVAFGDFGTLLGYTDTEEPHKRDVYLLGRADSGLQLARVALEDCLDPSRFTYYTPSLQKFTSSLPLRSLSALHDIYLSGSFSSGSIFYSCYFKTFLLIYINNFADSTFRLRFLDLNAPRALSDTWPRGGRNGQGIVAEDSEAIAQYAWSEEQVLYISPNGNSGYNYAANAHPEYFNRHFYANSLYAHDTPKQKRQNEWLGSSLVNERKAGGDGKHLLLSWTAQVRDGRGSGVLWEIWMAKVEFADLPIDSPSKREPTRQVEDASFEIPGWMTSNAEITEQRTLSPLLIVSVIATLIIFGRL